MVAGEEERTAIGALFFLPLLLLARSTFIGDNTSMSPSSWFFLSILLKRGYDSHA